MWERERMKQSQKTCLQFPVRKFHCAFEAFDAAQRSRIPPSRRECSNFSPALPARQRWRPVASLLQKQGLA